jgi:hypothetical protein
MCYFHFEKQNKNKIKKRNIRILFIHSFFYSFLSKRKYNDLFIITITLVFYSLILDRTFILHIYSLVISLKIDHE